MKVFIDSVHDLNGSGGGFKFLTILSLSIPKEISSASLCDADVLLLNSHHWFHQRIKILHACLSKRMPACVLRVDGPLSTVRSNNLFIFVDFRISLFKLLVANSIIYQSRWSMNNHSSLLDRISHLVKKTFIISNTTAGSCPLSDAEFYQRQGPLKAVFSSWSSNPLKGIDDIYNVFRHLDSNIIQLTPLTPSMNSSSGSQVKKHFSHSEVMATLSSSDIYIHSSHLEACSNSLIEAIHSGLHCIVRSTSSNPEIAGPSVHYFSTSHDLLAHLKQLTNRNQLHRAHPAPIITPSFVFSSYINAFSSSHQHLRRGYLSFSVRVVLCIIWYMADCLLMFFDFIWSLLFKIANRLAPHR